MTPTNIFLVALLAFINLATADGVPTNTSSLTTSSTEETWALITTWTTLACSTAPGTNDSAVVYGSTYSIPVNYGTCDPNDPGCEEAGRRCGIVPVSTSVVPTATTTSFIATIPPTTSTKSVESATRSVTSVNSVTAMATATAAATGEADEATVDMLAFFVLTGMLVGFYGPNL